MPVRDVRLPSATLHVREEGAGTALVLLACDPPNVVEHYDALAAARPSGVRMVVFEMPEFGRSRAHPGTRFAFDDGVRVVRELLGSLGSADATTILAFPCVTAYVALALAARHPAMVQGLVLSQAPSWDDEMRWLDRVDRDRLLRRRIVGQLVMRVRARDVARRWYAAAARDPAPMTRTALAAMDQGARFPLADAFQAMARESPALHGATQPALLLWGGQDRSHAKSRADGLRDAIPQARHVVLDDAAHFPELEAPKRFWEEVATLLAEMRQRP